MTESPAEIPDEPGTPRRPEDLPVAFSDPVYLAAVIDLLGAIAYGEMSAFERLSEDAKMAPTLEDKAELAMTLFTYIKATRGYWSWRNQVSKPGQIFHAVLNVYGDGELCMVIADDSEGDFGPVQAKEISGMLFRSDIDERPGFLPGLGRALH